MEFAKHDIVMVPEISGKKKTQPQNRRISQTFKNLSREVSEICQKLLEV